MSPRLWNLAALACFGAAVFFYTILAVILYDCAAHDRPPIRLPEGPGGITEPTLFP